MLDNAERTFKKMQAASCSGDVPGFFVHVDKTAMTKSMVADAQATLDKDPAGGALDAKALVQRAAQEAFQEWEDDIKRGSASNFCKAEIVVADNKAGTVKWRTPSGNLKLGTFAKPGDKWLMVGMGPATP
jgi:hypothetical protein